MRRVGLSYYGESARRENVNSRTWTHNYSALVKRSCRVIAKAFSRDVVDLSCCKGKCLPIRCQEGADVIYRYRCSRLATIISVSPSFTFFNICIRFINSWKKYIFLNKWDQENFSTCSIFTLYLYQTIEFFNRIRISNYIFFDVYLYKICRKHLVYAFICSP